MQKYFVHKNNQAEGPFSIDELKAQKITSNTMVWFEGAEDWQKASGVVELKTLFKSIPPPLENLKSQSAVLKTNENNLVQKSKKASIKGWLVISGFVIQSVFLVFLYFSQDENINALEIEIMEMQYDIEDIKEQKDYSQSSRINNYQEESLENDNDINNLSETIRDVKITEQSSRYDKNGQYVPYKSIDEVFAKIKAEDSRAQGLRVGKSKLPTVSATQIVKQDEASRGTRNTRYDVPFDQVYKRMPNGNYVRR